MFERGKINCATLSVISEALIALPLILSGAVKDARAEPVVASILSNPKSLSPMARRIMELTQDTASRTYPGYILHFCRLNTYLEFDRSGAERLKELPGLFEAAQFEDLDRGECVNLKKISELLNDQNLLEAVRYPQVRELLETYGKDLSVVLAAAGSDSPDVYLELVKLAAHGNSIIAIHGAQVLSQKQSPEIQRALLDRLTNLTDNPLTESAAQECYVLIDSLISQLRFHSTTSEIRRPFGQTLLEIAKESENIQLRLRALESLPVLVATEGNENLGREVVATLVTLSTTESAPCVSSSAIRSLSGWLDPLNSFDLETVRDSLVSFIHDHLREQKESATIASAVELLSLHYNWEILLLLSKLADSAKTPLGIRTKCDSALEAITMVPKSSVGRSWEAWIAKEISERDAPWQYSKDYQLRRFIQRTFDQDSNSQEIKANIARALGSYRTVVLDGPIKYPEFESAILDVLARFGSREEFLELAELLDKNGSSLGEKRTHAISTLLTRVTGLPGPEKSDDFGYWAGRLRFEESKHGVEIFRPQCSASTAFFGVPTVGDPICFLVDCSASMKREMPGGKDTRLSAVKTELLRVLGNLPATKRVSVISFDDGITEVLPLRSLRSTGAANWRKQIDKMQPSNGGKTEMEDAIDRGFSLAAQLAKKSLSPGAASDVQIVLLSDGRPEQASHDVSPRELYRDICSKWYVLQERGVLLRIDAIGIGPDSGLLSHLAEFSHGVFREMN